MVIGVNVADALFPNQTNIAGTFVELAGRQFEIVGVLEKRGKFLGLENLDNTVYIPVTRFTRRFAFFPGIRIAVKVGSLADINDAREEVRGVMRRVRRLAPGDDDDFSVNSLEKLVENFGKLSGIIGSVGLPITAFRSSSAASAS
jgi:putative ABC transport system permease protein